MDKTKCNSLLSVPNSTVYSTLFAFIMWRYKVSSLHYSFTSLNYFSGSIHQKIYISDPWWREVSRMWPLQAAVAIPDYVQMLSVSAGFCTGGVRILHPPHLLCIWCFYWGYESALLLGSGGSLMPSCLLLTESMLLCLSWIPVLPGHPLGFLS